MIHEGRISTKKLTVTESPVGLVQTVNADWSKSKNILFVKPRNIEASGDDDTNRSSKQIIQRLGSNSPLKWAPDLPTEKLTNDEIFDFSKQQMTSLILTFTLSKN